MQEWGGDSSGGGVLGAGMSVAGFSLSPAHTEVNSSEVRRQGTDGRTQDIVSSRAGYAASWTALLTETD